MIFIALGTQKFQMNRLLEAVDNQLSANKINEEVFAQTGNSDYIPENYKCKAYLSGDEFSDCLKKSDIVITHGGVSTIVKALLNDKKVIVVPRLAEYGEHVDNHQMEIAENFSKLNYVYMVTNVKELSDKINEIKNHKFEKYISGNEKIIKTIEEFIFKIS